MMGGGGACDNNGEWIGTSSFLGDVSNDCLELRPDVVLGSRLLLAIALFPLDMVGVTLPRSSLVLLRKSVGPFMWRGRSRSRSSKYVVERLERLLVGVGGIDWLELRLGGVVELLVRRAVLRLPPLLATISCSEQDLISLLAMSLTSIAVSVSASFWIVS